MSILRFREEGEEHNFWQNYTDLMSGFLVVFIIASMVADASYKIYVDLYHEKGITEGNINDIVVNAELYNQIRSFQDAQRSLSDRSQYFYYNETYSRFECKIDVQFNPNDPVIPEQYKEPLIRAGMELDSIMATFPYSERIGFTVVIDGRAAKSHREPNPTKSQIQFAKKLSEERARNFYNLLESRGIIQNWEKTAEGVFVKGSGFEGKGRYSGLGKDGEDRNKTFIIQIIPFIR